MITVDAKAAGKGKVTCTVSTPDGAELDVDVVENHDGTFDIYYTAPEPGKYVITIRFGGEHIPNSPFHVLVSSAAGRGWREGGPGPFSHRKKPPNLCPGLMDSGPRGLGNRAAAQAGSEHLPASGPSGGWSALSGGTCHVPL